MSDKDEPIQEEIETTTPTEGDIEAHSAESEELPWCGIQVNQAVPGTEQAETPPAE
jgi:hypothetical protein